MYLKFDIKRVRMANYALPTQLAKIAGIKRGIGLLRWRIPEQIRNKRDIGSRVNLLYRQLAEIETEINRIYEVTNQSLYQYANMEEKNTKMAITPKGLRVLLIGLIVMIAGYLLMAGGASEDPNVFNYEMFNFRRMVAAPVVIICGIVIEVVAIMKVFKE